jgi:hypothetical protein
MQKDAEGNRQWRFKIVWENAGNTPANEVHGGATIMEVQHGQELGDFQPLDPIESRAKIVLGARKTMESGGVGANTVLTEAKARQAQRGEITLLLCGIMYRDIFPASPPRHTKVCMRIGADGPALNKFTYSGYHKHNQAT